MTENLTAQKAPKRQTARKERNQNKKKLAGSGRAKTAFKGIQIL